MKDQELRIKAFGKLIKKLRKERGLSQEILAEECGVDRSTIRRLEAGSFIPKLTTVWALADGLNVAMADLFEEK